MNAMALVFTLISGLQTLFFGMWFDMEYNKKLSVRVGKDPDKND